MTPFEDKLRESLSRREPPPGFAARVLARVPKQQEKRAWFASLDWRVAAAAVVCLLLLAGGVRYQQQRLERLEGARAKEQVMLALRLTGSKLRGVQQGLSEMKEKTIVIPMER